MCSGKKCDIIIALEFYSLEILYAKFYSLNVYAKKRQGLYPVFLLFKNPYITF
ncbi:hypothetical protein JIMMER1_41 [Brevibacillus phage Jimmer1]|uniref:Uncharacterized protein n=4 Tax=Jimmervirus TaxID=1984788 RepID=S5M5K2_9CAUD|nr:hypothetical protein AVV10_gp043 [Brevibacillus phage Osiris]YP_009226351.1 hypothetical protein AXJ21_gp041 [Brevibacillus phage Jimmer1]YP_009606468.1 hypothetical protein FDI01_gp041 [Brevibacillus phage Jimmer2]ALA48053.1 hypothetical protein POWDER_43 [Brevibacillus phage Powder]AGR47246.1 hypothetical protein JIMMER2_41 [Brevibacillus phage Jimmer2]AGR47332.1 hypothetical protein JIMMER1_41 [Brevibacillus phage Jimmer1]ALA07342.1 hypothetical protein OSIRIS_43 [Brevibacillus phage Os